VNLKAFAPAKINLFLHVGPLQGDGYHPLSSWMVFADVGDEIALSFGGNPLDDVAFEVTGPMAAGVPVTAENLVLKARDAVLPWMGETPDFRLTLNKILPAASGIGGGSSDAAATLRLLGDVFDVPHEKLAGLAPKLGADVAACLRGESLMATGRGEQLSAAPVLPPLDAVLVHPGVAVSTAAVFRLYDQGQAGGEDAPAWIDAFTDANALGLYLQTCRNDLEAAACALRPVIGEVLSALARAPETVFSRMSGSGATCFALTAHADDAQALAARMAREHPDWWVRACRLGGPWSDDFTTP
jgi:4-diphosphocytidyl-2-C-methyl-D-erythritol kinase